MARLRAAWSRLSPRLPRPTAPGAFVLLLALDLFLTACLQENNLLVFLACLSGATCLWSCAIGTWALARLQFRRHVPPNVFAGEPLVIEYVVANASRWVTSPAVRFHEVAGIGRGPKVEDGLAPAAFASHPQDRKSTRLNSSHIQKSRMPSSA